MLITDGECSFVTYLYADGLIQWTTGDASGGTNGLGGVPAQAGFDAGDQTRSFSIPGSLTNDIINIDTTTNVGVGGQWTFRVDGNEIAQPSMSKLLRYKNIEFWVACMNFEPYFVGYRREGLHVHVWI